MSFISILNDVLGPVMRGPSSSHTAGSFFISKMCSEMFGQQLSTATFTFDRNGSYANVFRQQGAGLAFAAGLLGLSVTEDQFLRSLEIAKERGITIKFETAQLSEFSHPNTVKVRLVSKEGKGFTAVAQSIGGGMIRCIQIDGWDVDIDGKSYHILIQCDIRSETVIRNMLASSDWEDAIPHMMQNDDQLLIDIKSGTHIKDALQSKLQSCPGVTKYYSLSPVFFCKNGEPLFQSAEEMISFALERNISLGKTGLMYEATILGLSEDAVLDEVVKRYEIMQQSIHDGLNEENVKLQLLKPTAGKMDQNLSEKGVPVGGMHTKAAIWAMAVLHTSNSMGVICAAPTGGSAGVIPGVLATIQERKHLNREQIGLALCAASAIGIIVSNRATFAAESAGCQVEIGVAGAMAAAAVVEIAGGSAQQAADAAAISMQNTMGLVCDLVQGLCEIPCHTRNAVAASNAFVCADLIMGGYQNPIPLDETIDAMFSVGKMLPPELRCTAKGGLAVTPSGKAMKPKFERNSDVGTE